MIMYTVMQSFLPNFLDVTSDEYDSSKVFSDGKYYLYNKETNYLKARLDLFKQSSEEVLTWIVWLAVDAKEFIKFSENPNAHRGLIYATFYSDINFYDNTKGIEVMLDFKRRDENFDPSIIILKSSYHDELFNDFINGIESSRFLMWLDRLNQSVHNHSDN